MLKADCQNKSRVWHLTFELLRWHFVPIGCVAAVTFCFTRIIIIDFFFIALRTEGFFFLLMNAYLPVTQQHGSAYHNRSVTAALFMRRKNRLCFPGSWRWPVECFLRLNIPNNSIWLLSCYPFVQQCPPSFSFGALAHKHGGDFLTFVRQTACGGAAADVTHFRKFALTSLRFTDKNVSFGF